ncbi:MAG: glycosyltransferase family 39 protein [Patescibacteria group bacterium]
MKIIKNKFSIKNFVLEIFVVSLLIIFALILRVYKVNTTPGFEWDEPVYSFIQTHYSDYGYPSMIVEGSKIQEPYLYHPPFDFYFRNSIFRIIGQNGIYTSRLISVFASIICLYFVYYLFREVENIKASVISLIFMVTDGWLIYTNRLNLIENVMLLIGVLSIATYLYAIKKGHKFYFVIAGILLGFTAIYKHTGIYFLVIPLFYLFFTKRHSRNHWILYFSSVIVFATYIVVMYLKWGNLYIDQTLVQIYRTLGIYGSRGLEYSITDALNALVKTYWIYISTIITLFAGTVLVIKNTLKYLITKVTPDNPLLLSWSLATMLFLISISLKAPQYLIMLLIPFYVYLSIEIIPSMINRNHKKLLFSVLSAMLLFNTFTFYMRFIRPNDNALLDTFSYVNNTISKDATILTEESIGAGIDQIYYKLDLHNSREEIEKIKPDYIITYISSTQKIPKSDYLNLLISKSTLDKKIIGFKETITIYKILN